MPSSEEHTYITHNAAMLAGNRFPEKLWEEYCHYPDLYFDEPERLKRYYFATDGIQFHYPPPVDYGTLYRYWEIRDGRLSRRPFRNENFRHMIRGFRFYISRALGEPERECWKYAGCLVHALEDSLFGLHTLENAGGTDIHALERLGYFRSNPANILCDGCRAGDFEEITDYGPLVLGRNAEEFSLNLYSRYVRLGDASRSASFRAVMDLHEKNDGKAARQAMESTFRNAVTLAADVLFTFRMLRTGEAEAKFVPWRSLTDMVPVAFPFGGGSGAYRVSPYTTDFAFNRNREKVPLALMDRGKPVFFEKGFAFGGHFQGEFLFRLPLHGYRDFTAQTGLHFDGGANDHLKLHWINRGKTIQVTSGRTQKIFIERPGGWFGVKMESDSPTGVLVIGDPVLNA